MMNLVTRYPISESTQGPALARLDAGKSRPFGETQRPKASHGCNIARPGQPIFSW